MIKYVGLNFQEFASKMTDIVDIYNRYNIILYAVGLFISVACDYLFFYLITPINRSKK